MIQKFHKDSLIWMFPPRLIWIMAIKPDGDNPLPGPTVGFIPSRIIRMIPFSGCRQIKDYPLPYCLPDPE